MHFHNHPALPRTSLLYALRLLCSGSGHVTDYLDFGAAVLLLARTLIAWRRLSPVCALNTSGAWFLSVWYMYGLHPLMGVGRYMLGLLRAFFLLGRVGARSAWPNRLILYPSLMLRLFLSANFVLWGGAG
jgi:hypothetical protein